MTERWPHMFSQAAGLSLGGKLYFVTCSVHDTQNTASVRRSHLLLTFTLSSPGSQAPIAVQCHHLEIHSLRWGHVQAGPVGAHSACVHACVHVRVCVGGV